MTDKAKCCGALVQPVDYDLGSMHDERTRFYADAEGTPPKFFETSALDRVVKAVRDNPIMATEKSFIRPDSARPAHVPQKPKPGAWLASLSSAQRKEIALHLGTWAYFPDALALVARHSVRSNDKHNPGQPVHWARGKSNDQDDCIARHSLAIAVDPDSQDQGQYEMVSRAWRALAALQIWAEEKFATEGRIE